LLILDGFPYPYLPPFSCVGQGKIQGVFKGATKVGGEVGVRSGVSKEVGTCPSFQLSNEKNPGCLGYIGDYTTQLYRDYYKPF